MQSDHKERPCASPADSSGQLFVRSRSVVSRCVAGETLIVPIRGKVGDLASIYSFNGTGTLIWQCLESPRTLAALTRIVKCEYDVTQQQAEKDVTTFVNEMRSAGLVDVCPPIAKAALSPNETESEWRDALAIAGSH